jgi:thioester reductase-like protein
MKMSGYFITGATGFVGGALTLQILGRTNDPVVCLVRGTDSNPEARLEQTLRKAAAAYKYPPGFIDVNRSRIHVAPGDLNESTELIKPAGVRISEFWHGAASLRFGNKDHAEIFSTNVNGTRQAMKLAQRVGAEVFNHVSTAYVAGRRTGPIEECHVLSDVETNNLYERSKIDAECLVAAASDIRTRIWRPSIVVGHSETLAATSFSGMYGMMKEIIRFKKVVRNTLGSFLETHSLKMLADPDSTLNFIPVDYVVGQAVELSLAGIEEDVVHLTNELSPTVGRCFELFFDELGIRRPTYVTSREHLSSLDARFGKKLAFYGSYLSGAKQFRQRAGIKHGRVLSFAFDDQTLLRHLRWYLRYLGVDSAADETVKMRAGNPSLALPGEEAIYGVVARSLMAKAPTQMPGACGWPDRKKDDFEAEEQLCHVTTGARLTRRSCGLRRPWSQLGTK